MRAAIGSSLARDPDDPRILGDLYGRVLSTRAFLRDELDHLPGLLDQMMEHVRRAPPTTSVYPGRVLWALLHTIDDDFGVAPLITRSADWHTIERRRPTSTRSPRA